jgi:hypothetical protein
VFEKIASVIIYEIEGLAVLETRRGWIVQIYLLVNQQREGLSRKASFAYWRKGPSLTVGGAVIE